MRATRLSLVGSLALLMLMVAPITRAATAWGPESPPFNVEVVLREVTGGDGFGLVTFRQPNDDAKVIGLATWVRGLEPNHAYVLRRAVDITIDGSCSSNMWLTLGAGLTPQSIVTDDRGTGRADLFRDVGMLTTGARFDIHFQVADSSTLAPVLLSGCYEFVVSP